MNLQLKLMCVYKLDLKVAVRRVLLITSKNKIGAQKELLCLCCVLFFRFHSFSSLLNE